MANIHGIPEIQQSLLPGDDKTDSMLLGGLRLGTASEARQETFLSMLKMLICPYYKQRSFSSLIITLNILVFIICVLYGNTPGKFLQPTPEVLNAFGSKNNSKIQSGQFWRLLTAALLHTNFSHIMFNLLMTLLVLTRLEYSMGIKRAVFIYVISALGGNILSALLNPNQSVGASTALFGVLGAMIGWIIYNWSALHSNYQRNFAILVLSVLVIFNLLMGSVQSDNDNWAHFGGLFVGFGLGLCSLISITQETEKQKNLKKLGAATVVIFIAGGITGIYL